MTSKAVLRSALLLVLAAFPPVLPTAQAQIISDAKGQLRLHWLQMKRDMPRASPAVQRYVACIADAIIKVIPSEFQDLDWEVIVFDDDQNNAEVIPGGKIAVYSGILDVADTPDKLAAVLGHETAHLTQGHVQERTMRQVGTGFLGAAGSALTGLGSESNQAANVLFQLPYERQEEREADLVGMKYMAEAGYNPGSVLELWHDMAGDIKGRTPEFLSGHPDPDYRLQDMARNLAPALVLYNKALDDGVRPLCHL